MEKPSRETLKTAVLVVTGRRLTGTDILDLLGVELGSFPIHCLQETADERAAEIIADAILGAYEPEDDGR